MKKYIIILVTLVLVACSNKPKVPDYVIPQEEMVNIVVDIHLLDGIMTVNRIRKSLVNKDSVNYYNQIFEKYNITQEDFDTSLYFYSHNINEYNDIYEQVLNKLNEIEAKVKEEKLDALKDL